MSGIFGKLGLNDTEYVFEATRGQSVLYDAVQEYLTRVNADINQALTVFLAGDTEDHKRRYKLPGGGHLQRRARDGSYGTVKAQGSWDVAFPLEDFGASIASDDVSRAYMTVRELDNHISTVAIQNINTVRFELLKSLLNNAQDTFDDENWGNLSVEPLANGDTVVYPPVLGSESEATDDHYLESGYLATAISDTNNPYATMVEELVEHFGESVGGDNIVVFINQDETPETEDLTDFVEVPDNFVRVGVNTDVPVRLPFVPGKIIGRMKGLCWVSQWRWMPSGYMLAVHLEAEQPVMRRVDPAATGLGRGLQLVASDEQFPFNESFWRHRFGFGVANRLNGVVMELANGGSYTAPTAYS